MAIGKIPYSEAVIRNLADLGLNSGCKMRNILDAMPVGSRAVLSVTPTDVSDLPGSGELYITKSSSASTVHKSDIRLITIAQSQTSLISHYYIGFVPYNTELTAKWYRVTMTELT